MITREEVAQMLAEATAALEKRVAALEGRTTDTSLTYIDKIQAVVADHFRIHTSDMKSPRRPDSIARPRQIAMYFARMFTKCSLTEIGEAFGGRGHGAVIHALDAVEKMMKTEPAMRDSINLLRAVFVDLLK